MPHPHETQSVTQAADEVRRIELMEAAPLRRPDPDLWDCDKYWEEFARRHAPAEDEE